MRVGWPGPGAELDLVERVAGPLDRARGNVPEIAKVGDRYSITIQNLDGPSTFEGVATGDGIQFARNGQVELLHATDGPGTGMKWLQDKKNCLTVRPGEGFCRD